MEKRPMTVCRYEADEAESFAGREYLFSSGMNTNNLEATSYRDGRWSIVELVEYGRW